MKRDQQWQVVGHVTVQSRSRLMQQFMMRLQKQDKVFLIMKMEKPHYIVKNVASPFLKPAFFVGLS